MIASSMGSAGQLGRQNHLWQLLSSSDSLRRQSESADRGSEVVVKGDKLGV